MLVIQLQLFHEISMININGRVSAQRRLLHFVFTLLNYLYIMSFSMMTCHVTNLRPKVFEEFAGPWFPGYSVRQ